MESVGYVCALASAALMAVSHGILKSGADLLVMRMALGLIGTAMLSPLLFFVPMPRGELWWWLAASGAVHITYQLFLLKAYAMADFSIAYPMVRGSAPLAAALGALLIIGENLAWQKWAGVGLVTVGLLVIVSVARTNLRAAGLAVTAGLLVAGYTVVDASGVRRADHPLTFVLWYALVDSLLITLACLILRGWRRIAATRINFRHAALAGLTGMLSYGLAMLALRYAPIGAVGALRESSVLFALAMSVLFLRETIDRRRIVGAGIIFAGAALVTV